MQWPKENGQTMVYKTLHIKVKIEQNESTKTGMNSDAPEVFQRRTDNAMAKRKRTKGQKMARLLRDIVVFVFMVFFGMFKLLENDKVRGFEFRSGQTHFGM